MGKVVQYNEVTKLNLFTLDISTLSKGIYFVKIHCEKNTYIKKLFIIKQYFSKAMNKSAFSIQKQSLPYFAISILVFAYVLVRALNMGITYDEAWTLKSFVPLSVMNVINYSPCDANNHILNTLLIKFFYLAGIENVFFARLPTVLAFILYLFYCRKISTFLPSLAGIIVFILLTVNPFLLDFFSLARGYGLGLAFQSMSVYYLLAFIKNKELKLAHYATVAASIAVLANFSQLNYWIACQSVLLFMICFIYKENKLKFFVVQLITTACLALILYEPIRKLIKSGSLYYGGSEGFYSDTLVSLTKYTQYQPVPDIYTYWSLDIFLLLIITGICYLVIKNIKKQTPLLLENLLTAILLIAIISSVLQHYLLGTLYLIDRTALFYFPLFVMVLVFTFYKSPRILQKMIFFPLIFFFGLNFFYSVNTYKTALWYFDAHTETVLDQFNEMGKQQNKKISIDFSWPFQSAIGYYRNKKEYPYITILQDPRQRDAFAPNADYYIYLSQSLEKVGYDADRQEIVRHNTKDTLLSFEKEHMYIFEKIK